MGTDGPRAPGSVVVENIFGIVAWATPGNALTEDGTTTTVALTNVNTDSQYLEFKDFGFSIPKDAVIDGIKFELKRKSSNIWGCCRGGNDWDR